MSLTHEIAAAAARLIVEDGMEWGPAKRRAAKMVARHSVVPAELPDNALLEQEVRAYLDLFCADTQPAELAALRALALRWMERLAEFQPHLTGAVWNGTATRRNDIWINLFCDDPKAAELAFINRGQPYEVGSTPGFRGRTVDVLSVNSASRELGENVLLHFTIYDRDELRGALRRDAQGRSERGDARALRALMEAG